jgi:hypothetical protein
MNRTILSITAITGVSVLFFGRMIAVNTFAKKIICPPAGINSNDGTTGQITSVDVNVGVYPHNNLERHI